MSDNVTLNPGTGGAVISTDDVAGVQVPRSKIVLGADGVDSGNVSSANPLPVSVSGTVTVDGSGHTQPVSGSVSVTGTPTVTGSGVAGTPAAGVVTVQGIASATPVLVDGSAHTQPVSGSVSITGTPAVSVSGSVTVDGSGHTQPVSGSVSITGTPSVSVSGTPSVAISTNNASAFTTGAKSSIGTSAVQMTASSVSASKGVCVKAASTNTGLVYVGSGNTVTAGTTDATDGFELTAGDSVTIPVDNVNKLYLIASASGQKVYWVTI